MKAGGLKRFNFDPATARCAGKPDHSEGALFAREGTVAYRFAATLLRDFVELYPGAAAFLAAVKISWIAESVSRGVTALSLMRSSGYLFGDIRGPRPCS